MDEQEKRLVAEALGVNFEDMEAHVEKIKDGRPVTVIEYLAEIDEVASGKDRGLVHFDELVALVCTGIMASTEGKVRVFRVLPDNSVIWLTRTRKEWMGIVLPVMLQVAQMMSHD